MAVIWNEKTDLPGGGSFETSVDPFSRDVWIDFVSQSGRRNRIAIPLTSVMPLSSSLSRAYIASIEPAGGKAVPSD